MNTYKIILLLVYAAEAGAQLCVSGTPKEGDYSFGDWFLGAAITFGLLYGAGFFDSLN